MRMQTWRWTELLQMLDMTTIGSHSHAGNQALGEVRHRLVDVFVWQLFPDGLQGNSQSISCLGLWLKFMVIFQHGATVVVVQPVEIWRVWGHLFFSLGTCCLQPVLHDSWTLRNDGLCCVDCVQLSWCSTSRTPARSVIVK